MVLLSQILSFDNSADGDDANPGTRKWVFPLAAQLRSDSLSTTTACPAIQQPNRRRSNPSLREVEQYSLGEYAAALLQGADLTPDRKQAVATKLETYTGVPAALWVKANLRMTGGEFSKYVQDRPHHRPARFAL